MAQMNFLFISYSTSCEKILTNHEEFRNTLAHICLRYRYLQEYNDYTYARNQ